MKFRTDFVTNSSDASFIAFNVRNPELYKYLTGLGLKFSKSEEGSFTDNTVVTLPSGENSLVIFNSEEAPDYPYDYHSHSAWLMANMLSELPKEEFYYEGISYSAFTEQLLKLLIDAGVLNRDWSHFAETTREDIVEDLNNTFEPFDKYTEFAEIEQTSGFEGAGGFVYEEIRNGERVDFYLGSTNDLEEEDLYKAWDVICNGGVKGFMKYIEEKKRAATDDEDEK